MRNKMMFGLALVSALSIVSTGDAGAAQARGRRHLFGSVGLAAGQTVRLTVVNTLPPSPVLPPGPTVPPDPYRVRLFLLGSDGSVLASERATVGAGQSASLELDFDRLGGGADVRRIQLRAVVEVIVPPPVNDRSIATLEIVDNDTARTSLFVHPAVIRGFNPQPDPPRE